MFVTTYLPERVFDTSGNTVDRRMVPVLTLEGVTLNGSPILPDDFTESGVLSTHNVRRGR